MAIVTEVVVKAGYEEIYDKLVEMKAGIEEKIRKQVEEECVTIDNMMAECTYVVEKEVPDELETEEESVESQDEVQ